MRILLVCLYVLSLTLSAAAGQTATLVVRVTDAGGSPLAGASVRVGGAGEATTDSGGMAVFRTTAGKLTVVASANGYYPNDARQVELAAGHETLLAIELQTRVVVSETIVVTGSGTETLLEEAPVKTELISPKIIDRQIKTTLAEALQATVSGLRTEMNCQNCGFMQLRMNGLEGPYTQILEDGMPSYSGVTAVYGLEQVPAAFLDQIEVVKGGNSALYGPGAVAGVVNLIRREPRENQFRIDTMAGWHYGRPEQQIGGAAQLAEMPGGFAGDFYYRGTNRTAVDRDRDGFSDIGKRRLESGGFGLFRRFLEGRARLSVTGAMADEFRRGGDQFDKPAHETWITEQIDSRRYSTAVGWNHAVSPATYYNLRASHAYYGRQTYYGAGMDPGAYGNTRNPLWVGDGQLAHQAGRHSLLGGYQLWWEHVEDNAPAYNRTYGGTFRNQGLYAQDEWRASHRLTLIGGARFDKSNQIDCWIVSPRVGTKWAITDNLVWRTTLSTGFRAPAVFDEDLHIAQVGGEGFVMQNDAGLREEKAVSYGSGLQYMGNAGGRRYQAGFSFFHTDLRRAFTLVEDMTPDLEFRRLLRVNGPGAQVTGVDIDGTMQWTARLGLRGGFTVQQARWGEPEEQFGARDFFRTPRTYGFAGLDWDLPGGVEVTLTADYTGSMLVPHYAGYIEEDRLETSRRFGVLNAVVSRTFDIGEKSKVRLYFNMQNIADNYQRDLDRGRYRDSAYVYGPAEMRRSTVGLTYVF